MGIRGVLVLGLVLSLRRVMLALEPAAYSAGLLINVSLPAGRRARGMELGTREAVVATWSLRRRRGWAEIRRAVLGGKGEWWEAGVCTLRCSHCASRLTFPLRSWLAQAGFSTFSCAPRVLPRTIYLSHQFAFHTLGGDYHALNWRYKLDIGDAKIKRWG
jgi:hypothetical protein